MRKFLLFFFVVFFFCGESFALDLPVNEWRLATYEGAMASYMNGTVQISFPGTDYWHVQLTHSNIQLVSGKKYEVRFTIKGIQNQRRINARIGRESFPYDAFAEFAEITASFSGKEVTKQFTMLSGDVSNARFEFNVGKYTGDIQISDVSITCLDCLGGGEDNLDNVIDGGVDASDRDYIVIANELNIQDRGRVLGDVYSKKLLFGNDNKVFGNVDAGETCNIGHNNEIQYNLRSVKECVTGYNFRASSIENKNVNPVLPDMIEWTYGEENLLIRDNETTELGNRGGEYGSLKVMNNATIKMKSGIYSFSSIYTNVNTKWDVDLSEGEVYIFVKNGIRFGNGTQISIRGGPVNHLVWYIESGEISVEPDSKILGHFVGPETQIHVSSRTHIVGALYANKIKFEPDVDISGEPHLREISYNHQHFSPLFTPSIFDYYASIPLSETEVEMYVYADDEYTYKINGGNSKKVKLTASPEIVEISVTRKQVQGFPIEAFSSVYTFRFYRTNDYQIFWDPYSKCTEKCDGYTREHAMKDFSQAYSAATSFGRELVILGGTLNVPKMLSTNEMKWKVGFEMKGEKSSSRNSYPHVELGHTAHIQIMGQSPRRIEGLILQNGFNNANGGAISSNCDELTLNDVTIFGAKSEGLGGAVYEKNKLILTNSYLHDNIALSNGGSVSAGNVDVLNSVIENNKANDNGGAIHLSSGTSLIANSILVGNESAANGGAIFNEGSALSIWNATFFNNTASKDYGAIYSGHGKIGNSIFWKNHGRCQSGDCAVELTNGYSATHSSFSKKYNGVANYEGDPLFQDESNPSGSSKYRNYDAGLNLKASSPLIQYGISDDNVPKEDIVGNVRPHENPPLGVYGFSNDYIDVFVGRLNDDGSVSAAYPVFPVFEGFPRAAAGNVEYSWVNYYANSKLSRVIKVSLPLNQEFFKALFVSLTITLLDKNGTPYPDQPEISLPFYKRGVENGRMIFQTKTLSYGKPVLFSSVCNDAAEYEGGYVLCVKEQTDQFRAVVDNYWR